MADTDYTKKLYIMKKLILFFLSAACLQVAQAQLTDTITHRARHYYYSQWYDTCTRNYVQRDSTDLYRLFLTERGGSQDLALAFSDYTERPLEVLGVAAMVKPLHSPEGSTFWLDTNHAPEYVGIGYWDDSSLQMQMLDAARWDTLEPKIMKWVLSATPEYYPWHGHSTQYSYVYEAYFEKPVRVDSVFWLIGTTNSNRLDYHDPLMSPAYTHKPVRYILAFDGNHRTCAPINPLQHNKIRTTSPYGVWRPHPDSWPLEDYPGWGPFLPIIQPQGLLEVESADSTMGRVLGGNAYYPDGTQVTIEAVSEWGYCFSHWDDGDTTNPRQVLMAGDTHFVAYFREAEFYHIAVSALPEDAGTVSGGGHQPERTDITLEAVPNGRQYRFVRWDDGNTDNPRVVQIHGDTSFTAIFGVDSSAFEGIESPEAAALFALTPNPARESVTVTLDGADLPAEITVYDAAGHAVQSRRATTRRTRLSTRSLPAGHYFVTVATPQATATRKLVIK